MMQDVVPRWIGGGAKPRGRERCRRARGGGIVSRQHHRRPTRLGLLLQVGGKKGGLRPAAKTVDEQGERSRCGELLLGDGQYRPEFALRADSVGYDLHRFSFLVGLLSF